jgi:5-methylcytosine-specific restriction endonuclease McrA
MPECIYCGSTWHIEEDHVRAKTKGGKYTLVACRACNRSKGNKPLMQWFRWLKKNDYYRWKRIVDYNYGRKNEIAQKVHIVRDEA